MPHYIRKSGKGKHLAKQFFAIFCLLGVTGCFSSRGFYGYQLKVTRWEKAAGGQWQESFKAVDYGLVGPEYLRVDTVKSGQGVNRRIYDFKANQYWTYAHSRGGKPTADCRPLPAILWQLREKTRRDRLAARRLLSGTPPLTRHKRWPFYSGQAKAQQALSSREMRFGRQVRKIRIGAYPGVLWDVWVTDDMLMPKAQTVHLLTALGLHPDHAERLLDAINGYPLDIEMFHVTGAWRMRFVSGALPEAASSETASALIPPNLRRQLNEREERLTHLSTLLRMIDSGAGMDEGISELELCARYCRALTRFTAHTAAKRFEGIRQPMARRFLMHHTLLKARSQLFMPLMKLAGTGTVSIARDAADVLADFLSPEEAVQLVGSVLLRGWNEGAGTDFYLWATDQLRRLTGKDYGYWPGGNDGPVIDLWLVDLIKS